MAMMPFGFGSNGSMGNRYDFSPTNISGCENRSVVTTLTPQLNSDTLVTVSIIVNVYIVGCLVIMGFVGNSLSIAVLYRDHDKKNTTNWLLQTLAVMDTLYLVTCVFIQILQTINHHTMWIPSIKEILANIRPFIWAIASIAQTSTVWTVMLVTIDRYIAICRPLQTNLRSINRAKISVAVVCVCAVIYNIPRFFEKSVEIKETCGHRRIYFVATPFRRNRIYFLVYKTIMYFMFRTVGPLFILIILNLRLIQALQEMRRRHTDLTRGNKHRDNITFMLVIVVTVFVICEMPDLILRIMVTLHEFSVMSIDRTALHIANAITNMLLTVNSSVNFLIYCLVGKKFRKILLEMSSCGPRSRGTQVEVSETEPLTTRTNIVTKNGASQAPAKDGDVSL